MSNKICKGVNLKNICKKIVNIIYLKVHLQIHIALNKESTKLK